MGRCIFAKHLAGCFANAVWWRLVMANCSRPRNVDRRPYATANMPRLLFMLTTAQFILLAGIGHATLNEGVTAKIHQTNHAIHLICAAAWFGGLLPVLWCMQLIKGRWRHQAIQALMRFSWCGHFAVIGVLASGVLNALLITGFPPRLRLTGANSYCSKPSW